MNPAEIVRRYPWTFMWGTVVAYLVLMAQVIEKLP